MIPLGTPPAAPDATVTFTANAVSTSDLTAYTFSSQAIGTAASNRKIVVAACADSAGARTVSSITVGGVSATLIIAQSSGVGTQQIELWQADVPTGTTADIVVTWSAGATKCGIGVWAVYDAAAAATDTEGDDGTPTLLEIDLTVPAGGISVAASCSGSSATYTWVGVTEKYDETVESTFTQSGASDAFATAQSPLNITATRSAGTTNGAIAGCSFAKA